MDAQRRQRIHTPEVVVKRPDSNPGDRRDFADGRLVESFLNQNTNKRFLERLRAGVSAALYRSATHSRRLFLRCWNPNTSHHQMPYSPGNLFLGGFAWTGVRTTSLIRFPNMPTTTCSPPTSRLPRCWIGPLRGLPNS